MATNYYGWYDKYQQRWNQQQQSQISLMQQMAQQNWNWQAPMTLTYTTTGVPGGVKLLDDDKDVLKRLRKETREFIDQHPIK